MAGYLRGEVVKVDIHGPHYFVVVSRNTRNAALGSFLGVRMTSRLQHRVLPTAVPTSVNDPLGPTSFILCDAITEVSDEEVERVMGVISPETLHEVDAGLKIALALDSYAPT